MTGSAVAGALRIDLSMGTAQFEQGTKKAEALLDRFAGKMGVTAGAAAAAGTLIGTYLAKGIMYARDQFEGAITRMDELHDAAIRVGLSAKTFSELEYAAKNSNVAIRELEVGFRFLSNAMDDAAANKVTAATAALKTLRIETKSADGSLRASDQVLLDLADRFSTMQEGARKTALAIDIFGESGSKLIQMLNHGKDGIERFKKAAHDAGTVITDEAAKAANQWKNDTVVLNQKLEGLWRTIATNLIPVINDLFTELNRVLYGMHGLAMETGAFIDMMANVISKGPTAAWVEYLAVMETVRKENAALAIELEKRIATPAPAGPEQIVSPPPAPDVAAGKGKSKAEQLTVEQLFTAEMMKQQEIREYDNSIRAIELQQMAALNESRYLTLDQFAQLNQLQADGTIIAQQYQDAIFGVAATMDSEIERAASNVVSNLQRIEKMFENLSDASASQWLSMGDVMVDTLSTVFGESKAFAIAEAVINTAQAITKTLASLPFPANVAAAAAVGAMGAAQIAQIASTNKGSKGGAAAAAPAAAAASASAAPPPGLNQTLFVQGINQNDLYSGEMVRNLAEKLLAYQRDGGRVVLGGGP